MPGPRPAPITVPAGHTVWAGSDWHGQLAAVDRLLARAGLTDGGDRWTAPAATALVVTGDMVDRGPDPVGLVRRLVSLRAQAAAAGGMVALLEGNHEVQVVDGLGGEPTVFTALLAFGGGATLASAGMAWGDWAGLEPAALARRVDDLAPDFLPALRTFAPFATWGDVLLVHGGAVPGQDLAAFEAGPERLWIRDAFFASEHPFPAADAWAGYRDAGMLRVVFGHTSVEAPTLCHDGAALNLDTWRGRQVSLAGLVAGAPLADAHLLAEPAAPRPVADAQLAAAEIRALDGGMPPFVRAWWARDSGR